MKSNSILWSAEVIIR